MRNALSAKRTNFAIGLRPAAPIKGRLMSLGLPKEVAQKLADKRLSEELERVARIMYGSSFPNSYARNAEVKRFVSVLEVITPLEYAQMWQALFPDRDRPNWTECGLWEAATGQKTLGM